MLKRSTFTKKKKKKSSMEELRGSFVFRNEMYPDVKMSTYHTRGRQAAESELSSDGWEPTGDVRRMQDSSRERLSAPSVNHSYLPTSNSLKTPCHPLLLGKKTVPVGLGLMVVEKTRARETNPWGLWLGRKKGLNIKGGTIRTISSAISHNLKVFS